MPKFEEVHIILAAGLTNILIEDKRCPENTLSDLEIKSSNLWFSRYVSKDKHLDRSVILKRNLKNLKILEYKYLINSSACFQIIIILECLRIAGDSVDLLPSTNLSSATARKSKKKPKQIPADKRRSHFSKIVEEWMDTILILSGADNAIWDQFISPVVSD